MAKASKKIKMKNNTANKKAREKFVASLPATPPQRVEVITAEEMTQPPVFEGVSEAFQSKEPLDDMFSTCPRCNDEKVQKARATEASRKAEMILVIRDIVARYRTATNAKFTALSDSIQAQLKPVVEASNKIAISRSELSEDLSELEDNLKSAFGITDDIDPIAMEKAMFTENEEGDPFETPTPGTDPLFDRITDSVDTVLLGEDDSDPEPVESVATRQARAALIDDLRPTRKDEDRTKWN